MSTAKTNEEWEDCDTEAGTSTSRGVTISTNMEGKPIRPGRVAMVKMEKIDHKITVMKNPRFKTTQQAQGTTKDPITEQVKSGGEEKHVVGKFEGPDMDICPDTAVLEEVLSPLKKRKRGRPETTGEYRELLKERAERAKRDEEENERSILDPGFTIEDSKAMERMKTKTLEYTDDLRQTTNLDMAAEGFKHTNMLMKAVVRSKKGLKGTIKAEIKEAASFLEAALVVLNERITDKDTGKEQESAEQLRKQIRSLKVENQKLQMEMIQIRMELSNLGKERNASSGRGTSAHTTETSAPTQEQGRTIPSIPDELIEVQMETQEETAERAASALPMRPPIRGVSKAMSEYPPGIEREEDKKIYDDMTARIQNLVARREDFMKGVRTPGGSLPPARKNPSTTHSMGDACKQKDNPVMQSNTQSGTNNPTPSMSGKRQKGKKTKKDNNPPSQTKKDDPTKKGKITPTLEADQAASPPLRNAEVRESSWAKVVGRRGKGAKKGTHQPPHGSGPKEKAAGSSPPLNNERKMEEERSDKPEEKLGRRKALKSAAITLTCPPGQYSEIIGKARGLINIADLGIPRVRAHKGVTGAMVYEVTGKDREEKANLFANKLKEALAGSEGVRVARPVKMVELRIRELDEATTEREIRETLAKIGGCGPDEIKVGPIKLAARALGTAWLRCPLTAAKKIMEEKKIQFGWIRAKVELLKDRPMQCYRCMERGHVQEHCKNERDRRKACYNCGLEGHIARDCKNPSKCMLCAEAGVSSNHRMGSAKCTPPKNRKNPGNKTTGGNKTSNNVKETGGKTSASRRILNRPREPAKQPGGRLKKAAAAANKEVPGKKKAPESAQTMAEETVQSITARSEQLDEAMDVVQEEETVTNLICL